MKSSANVMPRAPSIELGSEGSSAPDTRTDGVGAEVVTVNAKAPGVADVICTVAGETEHVASAIADGTEHASCAEPAVESEDWISRLNVSELPARIGWLIPCPGAALTQKSTAVPLSAMLWGLPGVLSFSTSVAFLAPVTVGQTDAG